MPTARTRGNGTPPFNFKAPDIYSCQINDINLDLWLLPTVRSPFGWNHLRLGATIAEGIIINLYVKFRLPVERVNSHRLTGSPPKPGYTYRRIRMFRLVEMLSSKTMSESPKKRETSFPFGLSNLSFRIYLFEFTPLLGPVNSPSVDNLFIH
jgi:hypothetical protein